MKKILCFLTFFAVCFMFSSCGGGGNEELHLSDPIVLEDGSGTKYILYNYYGDEVGSFIVPAPIRGEDGKEGNGIDNIDGVPNPDGSNTTLLTITYTNKEMKPSKITVPNGVSVVDVSERFYDEESGDPFVLLIFSDGTTSKERIFLPKGEDGVGIESFNYDFDSNKNKYVLNVKFTNDKIPEINKEFDPPKGIETMEPGDPNIEIIDGKEKYVVLVKYTDGTSKKLYLDKPLEPNRWYTSSDYKSEDNIPNPKHGDFYFDTQYQLIKLYENENWRTIVNFNTADKKYSVTFNLNADLNHPASMPTGWNDYYPNLPSGTYGIGSPGIPIPSRPGYEFIGWCTKPDVTPTSAFFTDLTPVFSDLTLYAIWKIKEYTITFDTDGGTLIEPITQIFDTLIETPAAPTKEGYVFAGYYYNGQLIDLPEKMPGMNVTIEVRWEPIEYTITFITNSETIIDPITLDFGAEIEAPADPTKEGYTFIGWDIEIPSTMPLGGLIITALWQENTQNN